MAAPFPGGALAGFPCARLSAARCVLAGLFSRWDIVEARGLRPMARKQRCAWRHPKPRTRAVRRSLQQHGNRCRFLDEGARRDGVRNRALRTGLEPGTPILDSFAVLSEVSACMAVVAIVRSYSAPGSPGRRCCQWRCCLCRSARALVRIRLCVCIASVWFQEWMCNMLPSHTRVTLRDTHTMLFWFCSRDTREKGSVTPSNAQSRMAKAFSVSLSFK